jgi:hypothetical protein
VKREHEKLRDHIEERITFVTARVVNLEQFKAAYDGLQDAHLRWSGFLAGLIASIATGTIEGLIWLFGGHH